MAKVLSEIESLERIAKGRLSISRFGDGEFQIMGGRKISFQKRNSNLASLLRSAFLCNDQQNYVVGVPPFVLDSSENLGLIWKDAIEAGGVAKLIEPKRSYYSAFITRPDQLGEDSKHLIDEMWTWWTEILRARKIVLVQSVDVGDIQQQFLSNVLSVDLIKGPAVHAFREYESIKTAALSRPNDSLFLISLGPTATALAYELAVAGRQAIDIGHLWKFWSYRLEKARRRQA